MINAKAADIEDRRKVRERASESISSITFPNIMDQVEIVSIEAARL